MSQHTQPPKTTEQKVLEWTLPINRSGWAIAAGYVALFNIPLLITAPIGIILGILGLREIARNPGKRGNGRSWFAIVYGFITIILVAIILSGVLVL